MTDALTQALSRLVECQVEGLAKQLIQFGAQLQALSDTVSKKAEVSLLEKLDEKVDALSGVVKQKASKDDIEDLSTQLRILGEAVSDKASVTVADQLCANLLELDEMMSLKAHSGEAERLDAKIQRLDEVFGAKLRVLDDTNETVALKLESLSSKVFGAKMRVLDGTNDTVSQKLESLPSKVVSRSPQGCQGPSSCEHEPNCNAETHTAGNHQERRSYREDKSCSRASAWTLGLRICQCRHRSPKAGDPRDCLGLGVARPDMLPLVEHAASAGERVRSKSTRIEHEECKPEDILAAVLSIESHCRQQSVVTQDSPRANSRVRVTGQEPAVTSTSSERDQTSSTSVECLVNERNMRYWVCTAQDCPTISSCFWVLLPDISVETVREALLGMEERKAWDADSDLKLLRRSREDDPSCEDIVHVVLHLPWPFWDRDILQRRWVIPLQCGGAAGSAVVMRSTHDNSLVPEVAGRVRAFVRKAAYVMRPAAGASGTELTVCNQVDPGGAVPSWSQNIITRFAVQRAAQWSDRLRSHCLEMSKRKQA